MTGRAEAALHGIGANERMNEGMVAQPFDRRHLPVADRMDERDAGECRHAVELHGAGTAVTLAAGDLGARKAEVLPEHLRERPAHRCVAGMQLTVDEQVRQVSSPPRCLQDG